MYEKNPALKSNFISMICLLILIFLYCDWEIGLVASLFVLFVELFVEYREHKKDYNEEYFITLAITDAKKEAATYGSPYWRDDYKISRYRNSAWRNARQNLCTTFGVKKVFGSNPVIREENWEKYERYYIDAYKDFEKQWAYYEAKGRYECKLTAASYPRKRKEDKLTYGKQSQLYIYPFLENELKEKVKQIPIDYRKPFIDGYERELQIMYSTIKGGEKLLSELTPEELDKELTKYTKPINKKTVYFVPNTKYGIKINTDNWFETPGVFEDLFDNPSW